MKFVPLLVPISATAAATVAGTADCRGWDYATILLHLDKAATNPTAIVLGDGAASDSFTDLPAFIGDDTTTGFTIPAADTSDSQIIKFEVDLAPRRRYLELGVTLGATMVSSALCILHKGSVTPNTDAESGCSAIVIG